MTEPRASVVAFAVAAVHAAQDAPESVTVRLYASLSKLVGTHGFDVLLARSLVLARRTHPWLDGVVAGPGGVLTGILECGQSPKSMEVAVVEIVSSFVELLAALIGEGLALRLLDSVRHQKPNGDPGSSEQEKT
jgi:hypothetical protein